MNFIQPNWREVCNTATEIAITSYIQIECPPYDLKYSSFDIPPKFRGDWDKYKLWDIESYIFIFNLKPGGEVSFSVAYGEFFARKIYKHNLKDHAALEECKYYLCGSPMMNAAVVRTVLDIRVERENILLANPFEGCTCLILL